MIKINYEGKLFVPELNTENGEVDDHTLFEYHQEGRILYADSEQFLMTIQWILFIIT